MIPDVINFLAHQRNPTSVPVRDYYVGPVAGGVGLVRWNEDILGPRPTSADLDAAAASPEYQEWYRTHGGDPAATLARETAKRIVAPSTPTEHGVNVSLVVLIQSVINPLIARVNTLGAAASPSMPPLPLVDPEQARQYAAAVATGDIVPPVGP